MDINNTIKLSDMPEIAMTELQPNDMLLITRGTGSMHTTLAVVQNLLSANINLASYNLDKVSNTSDMNKPVSNAQATALGLKADLVSGKVPASQLPGFVDDIIEFPSKIDFPVTGVEAVIYVDTTLGHTYRWSGSMYAAMGGSITLGDSNNQAFDGARGLVAYQHVTNGTNPHNVTKADLGIENIDNTTDMDKPISTLVVNALSGKADTATLNAHMTSISNPHGVTKGQLDLGYVDNTSDLAKPLSDATRTAITNLVPKANLRQTVPTQESTDSPILVPSEKALINMRGTLLASLATITGRLDTLAGIAPPTVITLGLEHVDNTSDADKPVSTLQADALALKADLIDGKIPIAQIPPIPTLSLYSNSGSFPNPGYAGLLYVAMDTNIIYRWDGATTDYMELSAGGAAATAHLQVGLTAGTAYDGVLGAQLNLDARYHFTDGNNPHAVTKAQVGLSDVDNTTDMAKPISTLTAAALLTKQDVSGRVLTIRPAASASNLHYPTEKAVATALQGVGSYIGAFEDEAAARAAGQPGDLWSLPNGTVRVVRDPADFAGTLTLLQPLELAAAYNDGFVLVYEKTGGIVQVEYITPGERNIVDLTVPENAKAITVHDDGVRVYFDNQILYTSFSNDGWVRELVTPLMNYVGLVGETAYYTSTTLPNVLVLVDVITGLETQIAAFDRFRKVMSTPAGIFTIAEDGNVYSISNGDVLIGEFGDQANVIIDGIWIYAFTPNSPDEEYQVLNTATRTITTVPYPNGVTSLEVDDMGQVFDHTIVVKSGVDYGKMVLGFDAQVSSIEIDSEIRSRKYRVNQEKGLYFRPLDNVLHLVKLDLL